MRRTAPHIMIRLWGAAEVFQQFGLTIQP